MSTPSTTAPRSCFLSIILYQKEPDLTGEMGDPKAGESKVQYVLGTALLLKSQEMPRA